MLELDGYIVEVNVIYLQINFIFKNKQTNYAVSNEIMIMRNVI